MPDLPRSVSVLRLFLSANPWVTANAFWSTASAGSRWVRPFFGRYFSRLATVVSRSGLAAFGDCVPVPSVCMGLGYVAAYSGTTAIDPFSNELWKISWLATVFTVTVKPAFCRRSAYIWASRLLSVKPAAPTVNDPAAPPPLLPPPVGAEPPELPPPHAASVVASARVETEMVTKRRERINGSPSVSRADRATRVSGEPDRFRIATTTSSQPPRRKQVTTPSRRLP